MSQPVGTRAAVISCDRRLNKLWIDHVEIIVPSTRGSRPTMTATLVDAPSPATLAEQLALAVLEGDRAAAHVLSDLLQEERATGQPVRMPATWVKVSEGMPPPWRVVAVLTGELSFPQSARWAGDDMGGWLLQGASGIVKWWCDCLPIPYPDPDREAHRVDCERRAATEAEQRLDAEPDPIRVGDVVRLSRALIAERAAAGVRLEEDDGVVVHVANQMGWEFVTVRWEEPARTHGWQAANLELVRRATETPAAEPAVRAGKLLYQGACPTCRQVTTQRRVTSPNLDRYECTVCGVWHRVE